MRTFIVIAFVSVFCAVWAQKPYVELIVSPNTVEVNETFMVTVKSNVQGSIKIEFPEFYVNGNSVMNRMEQESDPYTGEISTFLYYSKSGSMKKAGNFVFGPAYIRNGNKVYKSNKVQVSVKEVGTQKEELSADRNLRKPAMGIIVGNKKEVYVGEALCLRAKVIAKFNPTHYESYESYSLNPVTETHELDKGKQVTVSLEDFGRQQRYVFEHDKKVVFPQKPGKLIIEPFEMMLQSGFDSYPVYSSPASLNVKALPNGAPASFNGAIGSFSFEAGAVDWSGKQSEVIPYTVVLSGLGNLHDVRLPKLALPEGFEMYGDPEVHENIEFTDKGAKGQIKWTYFIKCMKEGVFESPSVIFSYFDLSSKSYKVIRSPKVSWQVLKNPNQPVQGVDKSSVLIVENYGKEEDIKTEIGAKNWVKWVGYTTSGLLLVGFLFLLNKRRDKEFVEPSSKKEGLEKIENAFALQDELAKLQNLLNQNDKAEFYSATKKMIQNYWSFKVHGAPGNYVSSEDLNEALVAGKVDQNQHSVLKQIAFDCDQFLYAGIECEGGAHQVINKLRTIQA